MSEDTPDPNGSGVVAHELHLEWRGDTYWIVQTSVHEDGYRHEDWRYPASDEQVAQLRYWSSWPPGSSSN